MCGICGFVNLKHFKADKEILFRMNAALAHRGPDQEGTYLDGPLGMAVRRLSIIDLEGGHQPISNENEDVTIVFNGEIYNSPDLRTAMEAKGHRFVTQSDTETIVHLYEEHGEDCVSDLCGMFAFAIHDRREDLLFLIRDRVGIKPLYYYHDEHLLAFSSELTSLLQHPGIPRSIDPEGLHYYLSFGTVFSPFTLFRGVQQLLPGEMLLFKDGKIRKKTYWVPPEEACRVFTDMGEISTQARGLLENSVKQHLLADVPVGAFLSGGIDSSTVVALMTKFTGEAIPTFSIRFEEGEYDESFYSRAVARRYQTDHKEFTVRNRTFDENLLMAVLSHHGQPSADSSAIPTLIVSAIASRYLKVVLSGDGGDEVFAGYAHYAWMRSIEQLGRLPLQVRRTLAELIQAIARRKVCSHWGFLRQAGKAIILSILPETERLIRLKELNAPGELDSLLLPDWHSSTQGNSEMYMDFLLGLTCKDPVEKLQRVSCRFSLPDDMLTKVDRMSMACGLEVRVPFLDHRLVEFGLSLPGKKQLNNGIGKRVLRHAVRDLLPEEIFRHRKWGFSIPLHRWVDSRYYEMAADLLSEEAVHRRGILNPSAVRLLLAQASGRTRVAPSYVSTYRISHRLYMLVMLELWNRNYIDRIVEKPIFPSLADSIEIESIRLKH